MKSHDIKRIKQTEQKADVREVYYRKLKTGKIIPKWETMLRAI